MANTKSTKSGTNKTSSAVNKKTGGSRNTKASSAKKTAESKTVSRSSKNDRQPIRRELLGAAFFFLGILLTVSLFTDEGAFISYLKIAFLGMIGHGYFAAIPASFLAAYTLVFHKGKPVAAKAVSICLIPLFFGQLLYLVCNYNFNTGDDFWNQLFLQGQELNYGGVLTGGLGFAMSYLLSPPGATIITVILLGMALYIALSNGFLKLLGSIRELTGGEYREENYENKPGIVKAITAKKPGAVSYPLNDPESQRRNREARVDIPLGSEEESEEIDFSRKAESATAPRPSRTKVRMKQPGAEKENPTHDVRPMGYEETAEMIGLKPLQTREKTSRIEREKPAAEEDGFVTYPMDPPAGKKTGASRGAEPVLSPAPPAEPKKKSKPETMKADELEKEVQAMTEAVSAAEETSTGYIFPPISLLRTATAQGRNASSEVSETRERLGGALQSFGISASIVDIIQGPTVTRYDIALEQGVKLSRVTNLAGDIALSLGVVNVRIAPIPDKISTVGIEVPNKIITTVYLRDILESSQFTTAKSKVSFAIGKDIGGNCMVGNIAKLPHMLIAGTTGSGKSVCMNSLILSLLYKATPDEVRLIMVDPKMVELGIYNSIPHLYVPVVTDPKKAAGALQWSVVEMLKRYRLFSDIGVRDLEAYNRHCRENGDKTLPQVVIVIDELADLMMIASKDVEESICRVAQMGRAAGMHLIIATQRPSADVITGLMKANIPSRIAFAVSSSLESRIILDQVGAEKLIGMGDMLYSPLGNGKPVRIQGAFVSDEERENVIDFIKENCAAAAVDNNAEILEYMNKATEDKNGSENGKSSGGKNSDSDLGDEYDDMLPQAVEAVIEAKSCSVSMLQRRLKLGYSRAARVVDQLEELGIVGPYEGAKPRQVIATREDWKQIQVRLGMLSEDELSLARELSEESDYRDFDGE